MREKIKHLLIPKEFRVWCYGPDRKIGETMDFTALPSECNCANCMTKWRAKRTGKFKTVRASVLPNRKHWTEHVPTYVDSRQIDAIDP